MQTVFIFALAILTAVASQLLFKKGMLGLSGLNFSISNLLILIKYLLNSPALLSGMFLFAVSFVLWLFVLAKIKLSVAYPITSLNFVLVIIASYYLFGEKLSVLQYASIGLIILGVVLLSK